MWKSLKRWPVLVALLVAIGALAIGLLCLLHGGRVMRANYERITEITRGHVRLRMGDKTVTIQGEGYARGFGSPDFVIYRNSIQRWDPPFEGESIDEATKVRILADLKEEMEKMGMVIEIE